MPLQVPERARVAKGGQVLRTDDDVTLSRVESFFDQLRYKASRMLFALLQAFGQEIVIDRVEGVVDVLLRQGRARGAQGPLQGGCAGSVNPDVQGQPGFGAGLQGRPAAAIAGPPAVVQR